MSINISIPATVSEADTVSHYSSVLCIRQTKHDREFVPLMLPWTAGVKWSSQCCVLNLFSFGGSQQRWSVIIFKAKADVAMLAEPKSLFRTELLQVSYCLFFCIFSFWSFIRMTCFGLMLHYWVGVIVVTAKTPLFFDRKALDWWRDQILSCYVFYMTYLPTEEETNIENFGKGRMRAGDPFKISHFVTLNRNQSDSKIQSK